MDNAASITPCLLCGKPDPDMGLACRHCLNRVDDDLAAIPALTALAFAATTPSAGGQSGGARGKPGSRPPIDLDAVDAQLGLDSLPVLEQWEVLVRQMFGYSPYGPASLARLLSARHGTIRADKKVPPRSANSRGLDTAETER